MGFVIACENKAGYTIYLKTNSDKVVRWAHRKQDAFVFTLPHRADQLVALLKDRDGLKRVRKELVES